jgi:hypothetical protein
MGRVQIELERVISSWCDAEADTYQPQDKLEGLWLTKFPVSPPYNPRGVVRLVNKIHRNAFFRNCDAARNIGPGFFAGGAIQTVQDLHDFLNPCDEEA